MILNLKTGDKISRYKDGIIIHYGIYAGFFHGQHWVAENNVGTGVRYVTFWQFLGGKKLLPVERFRGTENQRKQIIPSINRLLGTQYDLFYYNCEHFANEVQLGIRESPQIKVVTNIAFGIAVLCLANYVSKRAA